MENSKRQSSLSNRQGQALVEYVLMLVVSVALVSALAYQIFRPMQDFLKDYLGSYVACLLETGELPALGNASTTAALQDEGCDAKFQPASIKKGRPPIASGSSSSDSETKNAKTDSKSDSTEGKGGGSGGAESANGASSGTNLLTRNGKRSGADAPRAGDGKTTDIPIEDTGSKFYNRRNNSEFQGGNSERRTVLGGVGFTDEEKKKLERKEIANRSLNLTDETAAPLKKISIQKQEPKVVTEDTDESMTFGNFFRILLIAGIIIALVMVLGSQALKIVKSQEK